MAESQLASQQEKGHHEEHEHKPHETKEPVNLRKAFPIALRSIFRRSVHWIAGFLILLILITTVDRFRPGNGALAERVFFLACLTALLLGIFFLAAKLIYEFVYYHIYYYGVELEHLVISRGVFFKTRASFPLARMADVYLERTPLDLIFFLYNLRVTTHSPIAEHGSIEGLSFRSASNLQNFLLAMVNTTTTPVDEDQAVETLHELKATEDAGILGQSPAVADPPRAAPPPEIEHLAQHSEAEGQGKSSSPAPTGSQAAKANASEASPDRKIFEKNPSPQGSREKRDVEAAAGFRPTSAGSMNKVEPTHHSDRTAAEPPVGNSQRSTRDEEGHRSENRAQHQSRPPEVGHSTRPQRLYATKLPLETEEKIPPSERRPASPSKLPEQARGGSSHGSRPLREDSETPDEQENEKFAADGKSAELLEEQNEILADVADELEKTQDELKATRRELGEAEKVLERAREVIERSN